METLTPGAWKHEDEQTRGRRPLHERLGGVDPAIDWIGYCEHDYRSAVTGLLVSHDCITMESARRLLDAGLANAEIAAFVETFGDYCPA